jgi:1-acyl-sn-glycerol-3-phosphate acyltransferase
MELDAVLTLAPEQIRKLLPVLLTSRINGPATQADASRTLSQLVNSWSDPQIEALLLLLRDVGEEQTLYSALPIARDLSRIWAGSLLSDVRISGLEHLKAATASGPTAILCNHTSYMDSSTLDAILFQAGAIDEANRMLSIAGPKVYETLFRRFATLCLNTLPVPQSTSLQHTARLSPRELAKQALASMRLAQRLMEEGHILLIFPEGSRTRTGRMQPFLQGVYRYLALEGLTVVPAALVGCDKIMDIETEQCTPGPVSLTFGAGRCVTKKSEANDVFNQVYIDIAALLPDAMKPI